MSSPDDTFAAVLTRRDALGIVTLEGNVAGTRGYVGDKLGAVLSEAIAGMEGGDTLTLSIVCDLPVGHPLVGIDLGAGSLEAGQWAAG